MIIHIGSWIVPLVVTVIVGVWIAYIAFRPIESNSDYARAGAGVYELLLIAVGIVLILVSWLIWALVTR
jgi:succinate dehydrogenase/fumarate reductase cytochrome b subunit